MHLETLSLPSCILLSWDVLQSHSLVSFSANNCTELALPSQAWQISDQSTSLAAPVAFILSIQAYIQCCSRHILDFTDCIANMYAILDTPRVFRSLKVVSGLFGFGLPKPGHVLSV